MKNIIQHFLPLVLLLVATLAARAQVSPNCVTASDDDYLTGKVFFNYGSVSNAVNSQRSTKFSIGQIAVGDHFGTTYRGAFGFWSRYLKFPDAPSVLASEGDLEDRVQVDWYPDPLSPAASSFKLYRDGALLATLDGETFTYVDFNVIAGRFYEYEVGGVNDFGEGPLGSTLGFLNPNGVVTGRVTTVSGNPVPEAMVTLSPTLGAAVAFDGIDDMAFAEYDSVFPTAQFTLSTWVKIGDGNDESAVIDLGSTIGKNWWLHTLPAAAGGKGVRFGIGRSPGDVTELSDTFPAATEDDWHHVAASYNGSSLLLYVDGELISTAVADIEMDSIPLFFGKRAGGTHYYNGKLDEVRFYDRQLSQTEIRMFMNRSVSASSEGLVGYWKFDEATGSKAFDQSATGQKIYFCGANWTTDRPSVVNAGMTDVAGFYEIAGINYGSGQTFTAVANKNFYFNQSLEFNAANLSRADLTDFDLPDSASLTLFVQAFDFNGNQTILSKADSAGTNLFMVCLNNGNLELSVGGVSHSFGSLAMGFHHLVFTLLQNGGSLEVNFFKNGAAAGSHTFAGAAADLSGLPWKLGARATSPTAHSNYFTGLTDEAAFFDAMLPLSDIQAFANVGTNVAHPNLAYYFNLNEGSGTVLHDMGISLSGEGSTHQTTWSTVAAVEEVLPHEMNPTSRLVTLNPSNTSVDQVDFTDQSTVPVSGYVRFIGTTCFQDSVEILVNGESHFPPVFTDEDGYFVADFEPGSDVVLSPRFGEHVFIPAFWELDNLSSPVAGVLFRNQTERSIRGQLAGGDCRESIFPQGATATVRVRTLDGCLQRDMVVSDPGGDYVFTDLPPDRFTVEIIDHNISEVYDFFFTLGGEQVDLRMANDTVDFIYVAPHEVEIEPFPTNVCDSAMLVENNMYSVDIRVFQDYFGEKCYLDSALLRITNEISDAPQADSIMTGGREVFNFRAGMPNIVTPFKKLLEVVAIVGTDEASVVQEAVVIGDRPRINDFVTVQPNVPLLILRDPPGDGSFAYREQNTTTCTNVSLEVTDATGHGVFAKLSLGPKFAISGGIGVETELEFETIIQVMDEVLLTKTQTTDSSLQFCVTNLEKISTSDQPDNVGEQGGDVFMGSAVNLIFSEADLLTFNDTTCMFELSLTASAAMDSFGTTYIYSEYFIRDYVIPELESLNTDSSLAAAIQWQRILDHNDTLKLMAVSTNKNISFDAGVVYEFSESFDTTRTSTLVLEESTDFALQTQLGVLVAGIGGSAGYQLRVHRSNDETSTNVAQNVTTIGFTLSDDDPGDNFTVDVLKDETYRTPVFLLKSGQSSCPHEPNTQNREGVQITGANFTAVDVPYNAAAVFNLSLGNVSGSGETWSYYLALRPESNPDGAIVKANGAPLTLPVLYQVPFGQQLDVTVTVERGPTEFDYEDLQIAWYSGCEFDRITLLALNPFDFPLVYQTLSLDVHFVEPCSPVDIGFPHQDWVLLPSGGDTIFITLNDYDESDPDLELIRVQYRRSQGDGTWINIAEVPKAELGALFEIVPWDTDGLSDGLYEIRAVTQCMGIDMEAGISHVIQGTIEREPPEIFGTPEPADGVLSAGDEISITFTEPIRCDLLIQADVFQNNNVGLYNTRTGDLVDFTLSCSGDKIVLVPNVANQFIENEILRVEVDTVADLAGNIFMHTDWEFFIDRNPLRWQIPDLVDFKYEDEFKTVYRAIVNTGGSAQGYDLTGIPDWVNVFPTTGVLPPGQQQFITFEFDSSLVNGQFLDTILLDAALGDEPLPINFRVLCRPPAWEINPADFDFSMNFTAELDIEGELSKDNMDIVAAFIGDEVRGLAYVEHLVSGTLLDTFVVFLTVYADTSDFGDEVTFQIWDASECLLYGEVLESFLFNADEIMGAPNDPLTLHTNNLLLREIPLGSGWNWISFNLAFPDPAINPALASLDHPENDLMKSQTAFASYAGAPVNSWVGSLATLGNISMYQFRADVPDTIMLLGNPIDVASTNIPVVAGWNWIGYLPQNPLPVNDALESLTPLNGDLVKSQTAFAQYVAGFGWLGNLHFMEAPKGYLLKVANAGTLSYPDNFTGGGGSENSRERPVSTSSADRSGLNFSPWTVDPAQFEHTMILVGMLAENGENATREGLTLGSFANGQVRGVAPAMYVEALGKWLFFLTIYANQPGELLTFKLHDAENEAISDLQESLFFAIDDQEGTVLEPMPFSLPVNASGELFAAQTRLLVQPNPFRQSTVIRYEAAAAGEIGLTVTDALGRVVEKFEWNAAAGWNSFEWAAERLPGGVYFLKVGTLCRKVVLDR